MYVAPKKKRKPNQTKVDEMGLVEAGSIQGLGTRNETKKK